ncbi:MAG: 16S rRNA (guanine(527)-N(7))-methyltransferase RsmG [Planctomycetales bacterium]|nr:16S rRNA (guanine(527)-N(7))-methyltransferase RsmG [Planctomycetales bacterium]
MTPTESPAPHPESDSLESALQGLAIELTAQQLKQLESYLHLLWDWNSKINLTRHTTYDLFARRDLLDAYQLVRHLAEQEDVLDMGSGGGVPGIVVAILRPDLAVQVCDSVAKKSRVLENIVKTLKLPVVVHHCRAQDVLEDLRFHSLVSRAVGSLTQQLNWLQDCWHGLDRLLAIKGPKWVEERGEARHRGLLHNIELRKVDSYLMPGTPNESVILQLRRVTH